MNYATLLETILLRRGGGGGFRGWGGGGGRGVRGKAAGGKGYHPRLILGEPATVIGQEIAHDQRSEEERNGEEPLFCEKWSRIFPGQLVVRKYFFPSAVCKRINTEMIKGIYYRKQDYPSSTVDVRVWGMALFCGWAFDIMRGFRKNAGERGFYNVAIDVEGEEKMTGFTTANLGYLLDILQRQCRHNVVIQEGFPWCPSEILSDASRL